MTLFTECHKLEIQLAKKLAELDTTDRDVALKIKAEFEAELRALLGHGGYSLNGITNLPDRLYPKDLDLGFSMAFAPEDELRQPREAGPVTLAEFQALGALRVDYGCVAHLLRQRPDVVSQDERKWVEAHLASQDSQ